MGIAVSYEDQGTIAGELARNPPIHGVGYEPSVALGRSGEPRSFTSFTDFTPKSTPSRHLVSLQPRSNITKVVFFS